MIFIEFNLTIVMHTNKKIIIKKSRKSCHEWNDFRGPEVFKTFFLRRWILKSSFLLRTLNKSRTLMFKTRVIDKKKTKKKRTEYMRLKSVKSIF